MTQPAPGFTPPALRRNGTGAISQSVKKNKQVKWWHEAIIDDMLLHPLDDLKTRSARLKYSAAYLSLIINSDMFKAIYEQRRLLFQDRLDQNIANKLTTVASLSLDIMKESLDKKRTAIPFKDLAAANDSLLNRLGYGAPSGGAGGVNVNVNTGQQLVAAPVTKEQLDAARGIIRGVERKNAEEAPAATALPKATTPLLELSAEDDGDELTHLK